MKFKKILAVALCLILGFSLIGCRFMGGQDLFAKNKWVMKVGDYTVYADDFVGRSAILLYRDAYADADGYVDPSLGEFFLWDYCVPDVIAMYALLTWADELGIVMTEEDQADFDQVMDDFYADFADQQEIDEWLDSQYFTEETYYSYRKDIYRINLLYDYLLSEESPFPQTTDEEIDAYLEENPRLAAKHIYIAFDSEATDENEAKYQEAEALLLRIRNGASFDSLMNQYSEDTGLAENPDGYYFTKGEMIEEFEAALMDLEVGEVSEVVEGTTGFHIIMRLEDDTESYREENYETLKSNVMAQKVDEEYNTRSAEIEVSYNTGFESLTISDIYWRHAKPETEEQPEDAAA